METIKLYLLAQAVRLLENRRMTVGELKSFLTELPPYTAEVFNASVATAHTHWSIGRALSMGTLAAAVLYFIATPQIHSPAPIFVLPLFAVGAIYYLVRVYSHFLIAVLAYLNCAKDCRRR